MGETTPEVMAESLVRQMDGEGNPNIALGGHRVDVWVDDHALGEAVVRARNITGDEHIEVLPSTGPRTAVILTDDDYL